MQAARAQGLPGVFVVGDFYVGDANPPDPRWMFAGQHFDAISQYGYQAAAGLNDGAVPYASLIGAGERDWDYLASVGLPYIPDITAGWDGRPANETIDGHLWWFVRTPAAVASFVRDAVTWSRGHPTEIVEPLAPRPIVFLEAWNELQEGSFVIPTVGQGYAYAEALSRALGAPWSPPRHALVVIVRGGRARVTSNPRGISCVRRCRARFEEGIPIRLRVEASRKARVTMRGACKGARRHCTLALASDAVVRIAVKRAKGG